MYFRNKAAKEAAAQADSAPPVQGGVLSELVSLTSDNDVIEITIQSSGGRGGSPVTNSPEEAGLISPTVLSPGRDSACHFFPTLSRSNSDLTRQRRSGRSSTGGGINTAQRSSSRTNIENTLSEERRGSEIADSELASLIGDDVESVSAGIDMNQTSNNNDDNTESVTQNTAHSTAMRAFYCIYSPIEHAIRSLLPALHPQIPHFIAGNTAVMNSNRNPVVCSTKVPLRRAVLVLASSITAIGVLAVSIVVFCESAIGKLGFSSTAVGATIVALGAEVSLSTARFPSTLRLRVFLFLFLF
jgi:Ca2+/Na+ antiporter